MKMRRLRNQESQGSKEIHGKVRSLAFYNKFAIKASFVYVERSNLDSIISIIFSIISRIYLKKYKVYKTSCPANSYNANLGRTRL